MNQKNVSKPLFEKKKEKHELKAKLAQRPVTQHIGIKTIDISSNMFYKNYYENYPYLPKNF